MNKKTLLSVILGITFTLHGFSFAEEAKSTEQPKTPAATVQRDEKTGLTNVKGMTPEIVGEAFLKQHRKNMADVNAMTETITKEMGVNRYWNKIHIGKGHYKCPADEKTCKLFWQEWNCMIPLNSRDDVVCQPEKDRQSFCAVMCLQGDFWILQCNAYELAKEAEKAGGYQKDCFVSPVCRKK